MNKYLLLLFLVLAGCTMQQSDSQVYNNNKTEDSDIVNGEMVSYRSKVASAVVLISYTVNTGANASCTGTFISNKFILTAQHCLSVDYQNNLDHTSTSVLFRFKDYKKTYNLANIDVVQLYALTIPGFESEREKLGLIEFSGGLPEGATIAALPEPIKSKIPIRNQSYLAVGYGKTTGVVLKDPMGYTGQGSLNFKKMVVSIINPSLDTFKIDQALYKGGVCSGDSGGPAFITNKKRQLTTIGVASAIDLKSKLKKINTQDECENEAVYLNLFFYTDYLKKIIESGIVN